MPDQNEKRRQRWLEPFLEFIGAMSITSKELDADAPVPFLDIMYDSQRRFLEHVCDGLDHGIHDFKCLKARQLGISTVILAMDAFWLSVHDKIQGALITDDEGNRDKFRILLEQLLLSLPRDLRVGIRKHNRNNLVLENGSVLDYLIAGKRKGNDSLGTSRALNFVHATEMCNWGSPAGVDNLIASLAQHHPHRLYMWESTAKGFDGVWYDMWEAAGRDRLSQRAFFIGWWSKEDYRLAEGTDLYNEFWKGELEDEETRLVEEVQERYHYKIGPEQIAWHRWMRTMKITDEKQMDQQYPWTEDQAFVATGRSFFPLIRISEDIKFLTHLEAPARAYRYHMGEDFLATEIEEVSDTGIADVVVWEEPNPNGIYIMGGDPAFGRNDNKNNHCLEVYRCYADKLVQVAEYASYDCETYQVAWVMAHLAGAYKNVWINLEVSGPGFAIMQELRHLRQLLDMGYLRAQAASRDLLDVFSNVKWYLYHRPDSMGAGYVYNWKTNADNKLTIMNQLRDNYALRMIMIRSRELLREMERVVQDGAEIEASGRSNDDRVFASALAVRGWIDWIRGGMIANSQTYERVREEERRQLEEPRGTQMGMIVRNFFLEAEQKRQDADYADEMRY